MIFAITPFAEIFAAVKHDQGVREIAGHILSAWVPWVKVTSGGGSIPSYGA